MNQNLDEVKEKYDKFDYFLKCMAEIHHKVKKQLTGSKYLQRI